MALILQQSSYEFTLTGKTIIFKLDDQQILFIDAKDACSIWYSKKLSWSFYHPLKYIKEEWFNFWILMMWIQRFLWNLHLPAPFIILFFWYSAIFKTSCRDTIPVAKSRHYISFKNRWRLISWRWANGLQIHKKYWWTNHLMVGYFSPMAVWENSSHDPAFCHKSLFTKRLWFTC